MLDVVAPGQQRILRSLFLDAAPVALQPARPGVGQPARGECFPARQPVIRVFPAGGRVLEDCLLRALTVGLSKELMDSTPGGSGFSFVDMAANATGIRLAVAATRDQASAHDLQVRVREDEYVAKLLPSVDGLPEQLSRDALQSDLGGLGGSETRRLLDEIDRRISALPLFR